MCTRPLKGFKYGKTKNGKDNYVIRSYSVDHLEVDSNGNLVDCLTPAAFVHGRTVIREFIEIPCGKCLECRLDYARIWSNRCFLESLDHEKNCFITLTYNDDFIPQKDSVDPVSGEIVRYKSLKKTDFQLFMKRLRQRLDVPIRYYSCGEYGEHTKRPHYHAIIFGWYPDEDDLVPVGKNGLGQILWSSSLLTEVWHYGNNIVGDCTPESCSYVARYVQKKVNQNYDKLLKLMNVEPEFVLMSRRPGIGYNWIDKNKKCYATFLSNYESKHDGSVKISPNRYFDTQLAKTDPNTLADIKENRKEFVKQKKRLESKTTSLPYLDALKVKEENLKARTKALTVRKEI